jgi:hypothetical protein
MEKVDTADFIFYDGKPGAKYPVMHLELDIGQSHDIFDHDTKPSSVVGGQLLSLSLSLLNHNP